MTATDNTSQGILNRSYLPTETYENTNLFSNFNDYTKLVTNATLSNLLGYLLTSKNEMDTNTNAISETKIPTTQCLYDFFNELRYDYQGIDIASVLQVGRSSGSRGNVDSHGREFGDRTTDSELYFSTNADDMEFLDQFVTDGTTANDATGNGNVSDVMASVLSMSINQEVSRYGDAIMNFRSVYAFMNDFFEVKRMGDISYEQLVANQLSSRNISINNSVSRSQDNLFVIGSNNGDRNNFIERQIFEVSRNGEVVVNGDLLLGGRKWKIHADADTLTISKFSSVSNTYEEKHVFT